ncbi:MAG TPA: hypothetical protein VEC97_01975 [Candidatus Acidoferrales bacterium]|nr:hypothetical protein [Candidatus Acidoferrales bacterium]
MKPKQHLGLDLIVLGILVPLTILIALNFHADLEEVIIIAIPALILFIVGSFLVVFPGKDVPKISEESPPQQT